MILPSVAVLEMTYRCNHGCLFCSCPWYSGMLTPGPELEIAEWKRLVKAFALDGVTHFTFTGGEAILKPGLAELLEFTAALPSAPTLNLLSNGRALTDDWLRLCARLDITLSISLPGLTTLKTLTASDTEPADLLRWFTRAKELGCETAAGIAVTKLNLPELYETVAAALLAGADTILLNRFLPGGRGLAHPELRLTPEEVRQMADTAEAVLARAGQIGHLGTEMPRCLIDPAKYKHLFIGTNCAAVRDYFCVGANGHLRVCNHSPVELCRWDEFKTLGANAEWMRYVRRDYYPPRCEGCAERGPCAGGCHEAARVTCGDPCGDDPLFCGGTRDA
jgi:radical SAM protein with 4Fe4S-binding SPASM domain